MCGPRDGRCTITSVAPEIGTDVVVRAVCRTFFTRENRSSYTDNAAVRENGRDVIIEHRVHGPPARPSMCSAIGN